jgi:hypothetical protein
MHAERLFIYATLLLYILLSSRLIALYIRAYQSTGEPG